MSAGSLNRRLLAVAGTVLLAFVGLTGAILDQAFRHSLEQAQHDRLQGTLFTILAASELSGETLRLPADLPEARLDTPGSGLYAQIVGPAGPGWRSPSLLGLPWRPTLMLAPGETQLYSERSGGERLYALAYGLSWEDAGGREARFTVHVAEDPTVYQAQLIAFRTSLWGWLGAMALALLAALLAVLRWSLRPLRRVARDLASIEQGEAEYLRGHYPAEIAGLTDGLNALLRSERGRARRYRDTLADLAHSLKTPLAVLRGALDALPSPSPDALEQIERIDAAVDYQLKRAASAGAKPLAAPLPVRPALERLLRTLTKAYPARTLALELDVDDGAVFHGDEGELLELLGNLLDNAYKWARGRIYVAAVPLAGGRRRGLRLVVEDDGPGIPPELAQTVLERGHRADEQVPGHGIGLAVTAQIVAAHRGRLQIDTAELGGARLTVELPAT